MSKYDGRGNRIPEDYDARGDPVPEYDQRGELVATEGEMARALRKHHSIVDGNTAGPSFFGANPVDLRRETDRRDGATFAAACAVADLIASRKLDAAAPWADDAPAISAALDALESLTRASPLRKVRPEPPSAPDGYCLDHGGPHPCRSCDDESGYDP